MGAFSPSWSQVEGESPGCRVTASSGGMTAPGMPAAGMSGYLPPPPGLPPIDFSEWGLPPPEAPISRGATAPPNLPGVGRSAGLRGTMKRIVGAPHPGGLAQRMPALPTSMLCVPQTAPPLRQPCPEQPAMPYQQAVQPPKRPTGRGVIADTPTDKTTPMGGTTQDHRRPTMRGRGHSSRSVSHPRGIPAMAGAQPPCQEGDQPSGSMPSAPPPAPERTQPQQGGWTRSALHDPVRLVANFGAVDGGRTWSISSGSTTDTALTPLGRWNGRGSRSSSLTTSSSSRRKLYNLRRPIRWTLWPTSRTSFIRPPASTWMASGASQAGSRRGAIIMG